jgi:hypothetical protein
MSRINWGASETDNGEGKYDWRPVTEATVFGFYKSAKGDLPLRLSLLVVGTITSYEWCIQDGIDMNVKDVKYV